MNVAFQRVRIAVEQLSRVPGDARTREELCRAIYPYITPIVLTKARRTRLPAEEAEDILQDALFAIYRGVILVIESGQLISPVGEDDFRRVIYRTADSAAARARRRWLRTRQFSLDALPTGESALDAVSRADLVASMFAQLNAAERRLIDLWSRGSSHRETARELSMTESSVKQAICRALRRLREHARETGRHRV